MEYESDFEQEVTRMSESSGMANFFIDTIYQSLAKYTSIGRDGGSRTPTPFGTWF